jgi:hypothetical protein
MVKTLVRWSVRLAILAGVVALAGRLLAGRPGGADRAGPSAPGAGVFPPITGDTWPPVPVNPARED